MLPEVDIVPQGDARHRWVAGAISTCALPSHEHRHHPSLPDGAQASRCRPRLRCCPKLRLRPPRLRNNAFHRHLHGQSRASCGQLDLLRATATETTETAWVEPMTLWGELPRIAPRILAPSSLGRLVRRGHSATWRRTVCTVGHPRGAKAPPSPFLLHSSRLVSRMFCIPINAHSCGTAHSCGRLRIRGGGAHSERQIRRGRKEGGTGRG